MIDPATRFILKWSIVGVVVCIALLIAYDKGGDRVQDKWDASVARGMAEVERLKGEAGKVTVRIKTEYVERVVTVKGETREIIRKVPVFVPAGACELPSGFRVLHDAAAEGSVPDTAAIADGAPVDAQTVAATVADNYGTCRVTELTLLSLQAWVAEQHRLNPGE